MCIFRETFRPHICLLVRLRLRCAVRAHCSAGATRNGERLGVAVMLFSVCASDSIVRIHWRNNAKAIGNFVSFLCRTDNCESTLLASFRCGPIRRNDFDGFGTSSPSPGTPSASSNRCCRGGKRIYCAALCSRVVGLSSCFRCDYSSSLGCSLFIIIGFFFDVQLHVPSRSFIFPGDSITAQAHA